MLSAVLARTRLVIFHRNKLFFPIYVFIFESFSDAKQTGGESTLPSHVPMAGDVSQIRKKVSFCSSPPSLGRVNLHHIADIQLSLLAWEGGAAGGTNGEDEAKLFLPPSPPPSSVYQAAKVGTEEGPCRRSETCGHGHMDNGKGEQFCLTAWLTQKSSLPLKFRILCTPCNLISSSQSVSAISLFALLTLSLVLRSKCLPIYPVSLLPPPTCHPAH